MDDLSKYLIIITLAYYLLKGLLYLLMWQMTYKVQEKALAAKKKNKLSEEDIWEDKRLDEDSY